jgi:hypothetical protein
MVVLSHVEGSAITTADGAGSVLHVPGGQSTRRSRTQRLPACQYLRSIGSYRVIVTDL